MGYRNLFTRGIKKKCDNQLISSNFSILCKLYRLQLGKFHSIFSQRNKYQNSHATYQLEMLKVHLSKPMEDDSCLLQKRRVMFATLAHLSTPYSFPSTKVGPQKKTPLFTCASF